MKYALGLLLFFTIYSTASYGQSCGCSNERQWKSDISMREATLQIVINTGNRVSVSAVDNLIRSIELEPLADALATDSPACSELARALAEESKVELKMIKDFVAPQKQGAKPH